MNEQIFYFFYSFSHQSILLDSLIIFFADILPYIAIFSVIFYFLFFKKKWRDIIFILFTSFLSWVLAYILKIFIHIERPFLALENIQSLFNQTGYAFPSGHATFFMALACVIYQRDKKAGYVFIFIASLIGLSRIAAGVHFPIDILAGWLLGIAVAFFVKNI